MLEWKEDSKDLCTSWLFNVGCTNPQFTGQQDIKN